MGIDLELADCAAAVCRLRECAEVGGLCGHEPDCERHYYHLLALAAKDRPGVRDPSEFRYRRFQDINETMRQLGMGFAAEPGDGYDDYDGWRAQVVPGRTGIPAFKLESNDRWLVTAGEIDGALAAYAEVPAERRAALETDEKWAAWVAWLEVARNHGGFEAE